MRWPKLSRGEISKKVSVVWGDGSKIRARFQPAFYQRKSERFAFETPA
jgi:hypothetical protein